MSIEELFASDHLSPSIYERTLHHGLLNEISSIVSYLPIALYAESLRVQRSLVSSICDSYSIPAPITGCIKDLERLWFVKDSDLFGEFEPGSNSNVSSLRHGNSYPLVNKAILRQSGCLGREPPLITDVNGRRPIIINLTFFMPVHGPTQSFGGSRLICRAITLLELLFQTTVAIVLGVHGILIGSALMACLTLATSCLALLQCCNRPIFAHTDAIRKDTGLTAKHGAATDIHVVVSDWNSSQMDVMIGYSSQLHALTNIPVPVNNPRLLRWTARALAVVLVAQAALLTRLVGSQTREEWGSLVWLSVYLTTNLLNVLISKRISEFRLSSQPAALRFSEPVLLSGRRAALAFISTPPMSHAKVGKWDWTDSFMPANSKRKEWQAEMETAQLLQQLPPNTVVSDDARRISTQVRNARYKAPLVTMIKEYERAVGLLT